MHRVLDLLNRYNLHWLILPLVTSFLGGCASGGDTMWQDAHYGALKTPTATYAEYIGP